MIRIALSQLNFHIGNFESNYQKMVRAIETAKSQQVDLIVFSELSVCGYPPHDLLEMPDFIDLCNHYTDRIAQHCHGIAALVGVPILNPEPKGKKLFNSACFIGDGKTKQVFSKSLLPTYDIFDEYRYFEPNSDFKLLHFKDFRIAVTICEDIWDKQPVESPFARDRLYQKAPMEELIHLNPQLVINLSASPFSYTHDEARLKIVTDNAIRYQLPFVYVNQVGGNTDLIFDGGSMAANSNGAVVLQMKKFDEDFEIVNFDGTKIVAGNKQPAIEMSQTEKIYHALILGLKDYFSKTGFKKATLGLSGGIDSAVVLALASEAFGAENLHVLLMPSQYSSQHSIDDAVKLAGNLGVKYHIVPIANITHEFLSALSDIFKDTKPDITEENLQARTRGTLLMALSNKFGCMLLNTSNKSEAATGYGTLYGDMNGGLSVLGDVYKTQVYQLARFINRDKEIIPINSITKPPSAELKPEQKDSDTLPEYHLLDPILFQFIEMRRPANEIIKLGFDAATVNRVIKMVNFNEYKRFQSPPSLRISSKAFGWGRRMPLVALFP